MQEIEATRLVGNGEYEAILRKTEVTLTRFKQCQGGWLKYGDQPVHYVRCWFEILDGSAEAADPGGWLDHDDFWPGDTFIDWMGQMKVGQRYRVRVVQTYQVGGGEVIHYSLVDEVLGRTDGISDRG